MKKSLRARYSARYAAGSSVGRFARYAASRPAAPPTTTSPPATTTPPSRSLRKPPDSASLWFARETPGAAAFSSVPIFLLLIQLILPSASLSNEKTHEWFRLKIENKSQGVIAVSTNEGESWIPLGHVVRPARGIEKKGFTASTWIPTMRVAATAVNAIHLKVDEDPNTHLGYLVSLVPRELSQGTEQSYFAGEATMITDIPAGQGCFGGSWTPFVGDRFEKIGQNYLITVDTPSEKIQSMTFENRFGGKIELVTLDGDRRVIGQVLRPVLGVGRFTGTVYVGAGRIRANHPGVIDISTSPLGKIGGFQIIPSVHAMSPEMGGARVKTQWMVIGPPKVGNSLEGAAPWFRGFIRPLFDNEDLLKRFLVDVRLRSNGHWQPMPIYYLNVDLERPLPGWADRALEKLSAIRILFPIESVNAETRKSGAKN